MRLPAFLAALTLLLLPAGCDAGGTAGTATSAGASTDREGPLPTSVLDLEVTTLEGETLHLREYGGKALLIVNTASRCGFTPQYEGLEALWRTYRDRGLVVLGFPSNDFGGQEPGSAKEIREFCSNRFDVTFPMMAKVHTTGPDRAPLYRILTEHAPEAMRGDIRWNFTKFLVDPEGRIVARFEPSTEPGSPELVAAVEAALPD